MKLVKHFVILGLVALVSCGGGQTDETTTPQQESMENEPPAQVEPDVVEPQELETPAETEVEACSLVGSWQGPLPGGPLAGQQMTWTIVEDGVSQGTFGPAQVQSTVSVSGMSMTIVDQGSTPPQVACPAEQVGRYSLVFGEGCATVEVTAVEDVCEGRHGSIHSVSLTRH